MRHVKWLGVCQAKTFQYVCIFLKFNSKSYHFPWILNFEKFLFPSFFWFALVGPDVTSSVLEIFSNLNPLVNPSLILLRTRWEHHDRQLEILEIREKFTKLRFFHEKSKILKFSKIFAEKMYPWYLKDILKIREKWMFFHDKSKILKFSEIFAQKMCPYFKKWKILEIREKFWECEFAALSFHLELRNGFKKCTFSSNSNSKSLQPTSGPKMEGNPQIFLVTPTLKWKESTDNVHII